MTDKIKTKTKISRMAEIKIKSLLPKSGLKVLFQAMKFSKFDFIAFVSKITPRPPAGDTFAFM